MTELEIRNILTRQREYFAAGHTPCPMRRVWRP